MQRRKAVRAGEWATAWIADVEFFPDSTICNRTTISWIDANARSLEHHMLILRDIGDEPPKHQRSCRTG